MDTDSIFQFKDYKEYLRSRIAAHRGFRGYQSELALAAGCQKSFLSQVLSQPKLHLTRDHAAELCVFWKLDLFETDYWMTLVDLARAGSRALKAQANAKLERTRSEALNLSRRFQNREIDQVEAQMTYYSSWYWSAIHIIVAIPQFRTAQAIAERLRLPLDLVRSSLIELERFGLVTRNGSQWSLGKRDLHLDQSSPLNEINHGNWCDRAKQNIQKQDKDSLHYSAVFAISREDAIRIHELLSSSMVKIREVILPSPEEEIYCLTASFFKI